MTDVERTAVSVYALCANNTDSYASVTSQRRRTMMSQFELEFQAREWHRSSEVICVWETSLETRDKDVNESTSNRDKIQNRRRLPIPKLKQEAGINIKTFPLALVRAQ